MLTTPVTLLNKLCEEPSSVLWEEFYRIYGPVILRYTRKQGLDSASSEDVLQETMLAFFRRLQREAFVYDPDLGRFRNFLFTIVHRKVLDARRRARVRKETPLQGQPETFLAVTETAAPGDREEEAWRKSLFEEAFERLRADPQTDRQTVEVFSAYAIAGEPAADVARRFGLRENAVYQIKNRITKRLQRDVEVLMDIGEKFT